MKKYGNFLILLTLISAFSGCSEKSKYEKMVERELSSDVRQDSLFLGYKLGMSREEFYKQSWNLNQKKLVKQGLSNQSVMYELKDLPHSANMYFFPEFWNDKIYQMKARIKYNGWAPWNKNLSADSLQVDVLNMLEQWYGNGFIKINQDRKDPVYVKVDDNREIRITIQDKDASVWVYFTDLQTVFKMNNKNG